MILDSGKNRSTYLTRLLTAEDLLWIDVWISVSQVLPGAYNTSCGIYQSTIHIEQAMTINLLDSNHHRDAAYSEGCPYIASARIVVLDMVQ